MNRIKAMLDMVSAEEELKQTTINFLHRERIKRERRLKYVYRYTAAAATVAVIISGAGSYGVLNKAVSYISIDINPSVELALNRFDNVVKASAYNDDGSELLENLDLKGKPYTEAIDDLMEKQELLSYLKESDRVDFTVVSEKQDEIIEGIQGCNGYANNNGYCHGADSELAAEAHEHGFSTGKYRAYMELSEYDDTVTEEECRNMTMRQIRDMINEHKSGSNHGEHRGYGNSNHSGGHHNRNQKR